MSEIPELLPAMRRVVDKVGETDARSRLLLRAAVREIERLTAEGDRLRAENLELYRSLWAVNRAS